MNATPPLDLDYFLNLESELGHRIRDYELLQGTYLVYKIPLPEESKGLSGKKIILAPGFRRRAVGNRVLIRGMVIRASNPFNRVTAKRRWVNVDPAVAELDGLPGTARIKYKPQINPRLSAVQVVPGQGILYSSYNLCHVDLPDITDELVIVREIDVFAQFPITSIDRYELGDFAMSRSRVY